MQQGLWFDLEDLYGSYYAAMRGEVGLGRSDANTDINADEDGEAREEGDIGEEE